MEIIDSHAHIYPEKIAEKATCAIGKFYDLEMQENLGVSDRLLKNGKSCGISKFLVHSCATKSTQVRAINEFIKSECEKHSEFIGFMTLHQDMTEEEMLKEVKWCKDNGFYGIKLHPDFQKFYIDDENVEKIYRSAESVGFPILLHTGDNRYEYSKPFRMAKMAKKYKNVNFIGAHFGGYRCWDQTDVYKGIENVYFDTSSSLSFISLNKAAELINTFGAEKFFFGTDFPMWKADAELERFLKIPISEDSKEKILAPNLKKLLKL